MKKVLVVLVLLANISCIKKVESSGYSFENVNLDQIKPGVTTKENVLKELGSPSMESLISKDGSEVWIYYSDKKNGYLFLNPKTKERKTFAISFDKNDVVATIEKCGIEDSKNVEIVKDFTKKEDKNPGFFDDILQNIGTVRSM